VTQHNDFTFPWPDRALTPNGTYGRNFHQKAKHSKAARFEAGLLAMSQLGGQVIISNGDAEPIKLQATLRFFPPDHRNRDIDNCLAMMKPYMDGIFDVLHLNDKQVRKITLEWADQEPGGKVEIRLEEIQEYAAIIFIPRGMRLECVRCGAVLAPMAKNTKPDPAMIDPDFYIQNYPREEKEPK
jgi:crossover junction endodeoxyribonuclease RusA